MPNERRRRHSRSKSRERHRSRRDYDEKFDGLNTRLHNLTKVVESLVNMQKQNANESVVATNDKAEKSADTEKGDINNQEIIIEPEANEAETNDDNVLKVLGIDPNNSTYKEVKYHPELKNTWLKWKVEGLPEKNKKDILEAYNRKGTEFFVEAPKLNLEIIPLLSDIAKKRDQHFADTQNCIGTALTILGAAVSLIVGGPEEELDGDLISDYISHAGQILADVFHQQSIARKSFITPQLSKSVKPVVESTVSNEWLYGDNLREKVKDIKEIEKACAEIKEKAPQKGIKSQGNLRGPPANYR